jgi:hypothetical protein
LREWIFLGSDKILDRPMLILAKRIVNVGVPFSTSVLQMRIKNTVGQALSESSELLGQASFGRC